MAVPYQVVVTKHWPEPKRWHIHLARAYSPAAPSGVCRSHASATRAQARGEGFGLIVDDLLRLPARPSLLAEGFRLLPGLLRPLLAEPGHAVWLIPIPAFRRAAFESRRTLWEIARKTSDPDRALRNLLDRDRMFAERLRREANRLGLRVIEVGTTISEDDLADRVTRALGLATG